MAVTSSGFEAFQARYKYKILGQSDLTYMNLSSSVNNDDLSAKLKSKRTLMAGQLAQINLSSDSASIKAKRSAHVQLNFLRVAAPEIYNVRDTARVSSASSAVGRMTSELYDAMNSYLSSTDRTATEDAAFAASVKGVLDKLSKTAVELKGRARADGVIFNGDLYKAMDKMAALRELISNMPPAAAPAEPAEPPAEDPAANPDAVDIMV